MPDPIATTADQGPNTPTPASTSKREVTKRTCSLLKRCILSITNLILIGLTTAYLSLAARHHTVIAANQSFFDNQFAQFDLAQQRTGYIIAICSILYQTLTIPFILILPDSTISLLILMHLVFDIPLALVAESPFGQQILYSSLDPTPTYVNCYSAGGSTAQQARFWSAYARISGRTSAGVCREFVEEGGALRAMLLVPWFMVLVSFVLVAGVGALCVPRGERRWTDFFVFLTGVDSGTFGKNRSGESGGCVGMVSWFKVRLPGLRRGKVSETEAGSDVLTLVDEEAVVVKIDGKV